MKYVRDSSEHEMVSEFLKAELNSPRWNSNVSEAIKKYKTSNDIINNPNLLDRKENLLRRKILGECRGFKKDKSLFQKFPKKVEWKIMILNQRDFGIIKYINYDYWVKLSGDTRLAIKGAENVKKGIEIFNESNDQFWKLAKYINGGGNFPKIILIQVSSRPRSLKLLEGHVRLTSYLLSDLHSKPLEAIVGFPVKKRSSKKST